MATHDMPVAPQQRRTAPRQRHIPTKPLNQDPRAVREARLARSLSQAELADRIGHGPSYVCEIENGSRDARPELLKLIADALDVPLALVERPRERSQCPDCDYRYDVRDDNRTPLHLRADNTFCPAGQPATARAA